MSDAEIRIPRNAVAQGECNKWTQDLTLEWPFPTNSTGAVISNDTNDSVTFTFTQTGISSDPVITGYFELTGIKVFIHGNPIQFPNAAEPGISN